MWITPGSIFAAFVWLLLTLAFGFYVGNFTNYARDLRLAGGGRGLLTWMYLSAYAFVFGAELNSEIEHQTAKDSTTGRPRPMGTRGAWAADHVAPDDTSRTARRAARRREAKPSSATRSGEEKAQAAGSSLRSPARRSSAACSFSNARTSIWRMRSRLTP